MYRRIALALVLIVVALLAASYFALERRPAADPLPMFRISPDSVTISGISSGGFLAAQAQIALSDLIHGAAIIQAGPYGCAGDGGAGAMMGRCGGSQAFDLAALEAQVRRLASEAKLPPLENLRKTRVFAVAGGKDPWILPHAVEQGLALFRRLAPEIKSEYLEVPGAGHAWISPEAEQPCEASAGLLLNRCDVDVPGRLLAFLYGDLQARIARPQTAVRPFLQAEFVVAGAPGDHSIDTVGWYFAPAECVAGATCRLHIALHGCMQEYSVIGDHFVHRSGLNQWAESNRIIVVYPQAVLSRFGGNPNGCWDIWGYTGPDYLTTKAPQIDFLRQLVRRLTTASNGQHKGA